VPADLSGLPVGACVVVPFGTTTAIGYVVGFPDALPADLPEENVKPIAARVVGQGADIAPAVLETARYLSRHYFCDIAQAVLSVVPQAQAAQTEKRVVLCDGYDIALPGITTKSHREVILALSNLPGRAATVPQLSALLGGATLTSPIKILREKGILREEWRVLPPKVSAKSVKSVRLLVTWDDAEDEANRREEAKKPAQAILLRKLIEIGGGPLPLAEAKAMGATDAAVKRLEETGVIAVENMEVRRRPFRFDSAAAVPPVLMGEQEHAVAEIKTRLDSGVANTALLFGVTGSGKTEVYLRAIAETRRRGRTALVLVPEIALTTQVVDRFRARIGDRVAMLHSGLSQGEKRDEWQRIAQGKADVVVGARSAIFAPLANVGLIVVDEEHEGSYKQDSPAPRYHARETAIARAQITGATVLLGSATPAVESFYKAESGEWGFLPLRERALSRPLPPVEVLDLRELYKDGTPGMFAPQLIEAIADRLTKGEQTILFLNRRGFAMFLLCRDCGYTTRCPHCDVSLTFHQAARKLTCHHCGYERPAPDMCPSCHGTRIKPFGIGTEKVEAEVRRLFENARVLRMDRDTTAKKDAHLQMLRTFRDGNADILIGTQMVAKGLDFAGVTLVGVISADTALNMPDFRAAERAFSLLTQVSGRAGRGFRPGHVFVQTFNPEHESVAAAANHDYELFYRREITNRRELAYPPFTRLVNIISSDENPRAAEGRLRLLATRLGAEKKTDLSGPILLFGAGADGDIAVLGPAPCPLSRLKNKYRWHLLLKTTDIELLRGRLREAWGYMSQTDRHGMTIDVDPLSLM
ncbi:MAG: primosomal protein N', partial [Armatimonadetes bacterium]|nr:primosomal protein N' [Armatimonadota bacterium]